MRGQAGFWDVDERYERLSASGDPLEKLNTVVPWEVFRKPLAKALKRCDGAKGGRPPFDAVLMFKILVLQALYDGAQLRNVLSRENTGSTVSATKLAPYEVDQFADRAEQWTIPAVDEAVAPAHNRFDQRDLPEAAVYEFLERRENSDGKTVSRNAEDRQAVVVDFRLEGQSDLREGPRRHAVDAAVRLEGGDDLPGEFPPGHLLPVEEAVTLAADSDEQVLRQQCCSKRSASNGARPIPTSTSPSRTRRATSGLGTSCSMTRACGWSCRKRRTSAGSRRLVSEETAAMRTLWRSDSASARMSREASSRFVSTALASGSSE